MTRPTGCSRISAIYTEVEIQKQEKKRCLPFCPKMQLPTRTRSRELESHQEQAAQNLSVLHSIF
ncbi:hypothetical protein NC651_015798 [Populus alba x Populus x berolinensis]|nr:hypothetical protein NC651_015798 [Populus alba x Populus x berolinensis]